MINRAIARAQRLKMKEATINLLCLPVTAPGWVVGKAWFGIKLLCALFVEGFVKGNSP